VEGPKSYFNNPVNPTSFCHVAPQNQPAGNSCIPQCRTTAGQTLKDEHRHDHEDARREPRNSQVALVSTTEN